MEQLIKSYELAKEWILESGIQNTSKVKTYNGGFNSWFDTKNKNYPYIYSEITGYGITTLLYMNQTLNENVLERAKLAADWLINNAVDLEGGVKTRLYYDNSAENENINSFKNRTLYTFDTGMALYGVVNLYKITKTPSYLKHIHQMNKFINKMKKDILFHPIFKGNKKETIDDDKKWSTQAGSYHSKLILSILDSYSITKDEDLLGLVKKICSESLSFQEDNGRFITCTSDNSTLLHPHCYSVEGLLYAAIKLGDNKLLNKLKSSVEWMLNSQLKSGGVPSLYINNAFLNNERSDIIAQCLRLSVILRQLDVLDKVYDKKIDRLMKRLLTFQNKENSQMGGFFYGQDEITGQQFAHLNSWATMFSLQAIKFYQLYKNREKIDVDLFI